MKVQTGIAVSLIIIAIFASVYLFIRPIFVKPPQIVTDRNLEYIGKSPEGESAYKVAKEEITYWITQIAKLAPVSSSLLAMFIMWRKHKKEMEECRRNNNERHA